ncbi:MAG: hypothetical protein KDD56_07410 [Bdellovibrionales bacterium]|nr:hypothetical protein [Bdellovibrionales bacterium]
MELTEKQLKDLAKETGLNNNGIKRLLGSITIVFKSQTEEGGVKEEKSDLGLRLNSKEIMLKIQKNFDLNQISGLIIDYRNNCANIVNWIMRGDFNPKKIPDNLTKANFLHASRTAGRLRAKILRSF